MSDLVEKVQKAIISEVFGLTQPGHGDVFSWLDDNSQPVARAAIAAVIEFLYVEAGRSVCPGAAHEYLSAKFLEKQMEAKE